MQQGFITPNQEMRRTFLPCPSKREDSSYDSYIELLKKNGMELNPKCFLSYFELKNQLEYQGIATNSEISPNQLLVKIPKKMVLSSFFASQRSELQQLFKENFYHDQQRWQYRVFNTYLLYIYGQKQVQNVWYHMVENLSKEIDILAFWPEEDLNKFKDQRLKSSAQTRRQSFEQQWKNFQDIKEKHQILQHQVFCKENYKWIYIHLQSRSFGKQIQFLSLVPFCEFFNHHVVSSRYNIETYKKSQEQKEEMGQNEQNESITTEGSYLSDDYVEVGQFEYDQIECQPYPQQTKQIEGLNQNEKESVQLQTKKILQLIENQLNWQDSTILFIIQLMDRSQLISTKYKKGLISFQNTLAQLQLLQDSIFLFIQKIKQYYKSFKPKQYAQQNQQLKMKQTKNQLSNQSIEPKQQNLIEFPTQQKIPYDQFQIKTGKRDHYLPYNQLYTSYGKNSNKTLLLSYGFAIEGNKYEYVWLSFDISDYLKYFPHTFQKIREKNISMRRKFKIRINRLNMKLILFFRLNSWSFNGKQSVQELFSIKNYPQQIAILKQIKQALQSRLEQYGKEDYGQLTNKQLSYHDYFVTVYHQQEIKILNQHIVFIEKIIKFLQQLEKGIQPEKAKQEFSPQQKFIFRHYLNQF